MPDSTPYRTSIRTKSQQAKSEEAKESLNL